MPAITDQDGDVAQVINGALVVSVGNTPNETGVWSYLTGSSGTASVPVGARVIGIVAHGTTAASMSVNGGPSIPIPANVGIELEPKANLVGPFNVVFTGTDTYVIELLT